MAHRSDFTIKRTQGVRMGMCDVCTEIMPNEVDRYQTFVGGTPVSEICLDCAGFLTKLVNGDRMKVARAARQPDGAPGAVVVAEAVA